MQEPLSINHFPLALVEPSLPAEGQSVGSWRELAICSNPSARQLVPLQLSLQLSVLPLILVEDDQGRTLTLLAQHALSLEELQQLRFVANAAVEYEVAAESDLQAAIYGAYEGGSERLQQQVAAVSTLLEPAHLDSPKPLASRDERPVPMLLEAILARADALAASDLHLEPVERGLRVRFRVNGSLEQDRELVLTSDLAAQLVRRLKILTELDTTCQNRAQEGGFVWRSGSRAIRMRVSIVPQIFGEKAVIRLLDNNETPKDLSTRQGFLKLGLTPYQDKVVRLHLGAPAGAVFVCGPTGSGKSTLLYSMMELLNDERRNIVSIEDPVERLIPGVNQLSVGGRGYQAFSELLAPVLRQDPDILMIGEIRERETAEMALTAAITGHLVLSTVHAGNVFELFTRLRQFGVSPDLIGTALRLVVAQRLVPLNCQRCLQPIRATAELSNWFGIAQGKSLAKAVGCLHCRQTGVGKRLGVFEVLPITGAIREVITETALGSQSISSGSNFIGEIKRCAREEGFLSYAHSVRELLCQGLISPASACRVLGFPLDS